MIPWPASRMRRIWIDTDLALGAARGDVDDGFALAAVAAAPGVELLGVSSVFGNTASRTAAECARRLLAALHKEVPVIDGAGATGEETDAARAIAGLPEGTAVLALGPLTNVARALAIDADLARRIHVRAVGGNLATWGRFAPLWPFEFNFAKDPEAARAVLAAPGLERRIFPLDVCARLTVGVAGLQRLARSGEAGAYLARHSWRWLAYAPLRYQRLSFPLWDLVPALDALSLIEIRVEERRLGIDRRGGLTDGGDRSLWVRRIDPAAAWQAFLGLLKG
ncbi:MAG: nucleoside hydrolase [Myxococcales bacterium]|nr:nucleoside hydrolase [Myxococcales bacterium]